MKGNSAIFIRAIAALRRLGNAGVEQEVGEWIAIQDSDDLSAPNHLEVLYDHVSKHPDCGMVFANGRYLSGKEH